MNIDLDAAEIQRLKDDSYKDMREILDELRSHEPEVAEAAGVAVGSALGGAASFTALYVGGSVAGLSAAGITSGLAAAGALVGGGMAAGVSVLAAPAVLLGVAGYGVAKRRRKAKLAAALSRAIEKLYNVQERLTANAEYFRDELAEIKAFIDHFENRMP